MQFVDINVELLAQTQLDHAAVRRWLDGLGATECQVDLADVITDPEQLVGLAGKRCYKSFQPGLNPNVTKIRSEWGAYFDNILKSGHGSVLEHANYTFAFENVSRVFTAEMNRHRAGVAISEQSLRYVRFENIPFWLPPSIGIDPHVGGPACACPEVGIRTCDICRPALDRKEKNEATRAAIVRALEAIEREYIQLVKIWDFDNMKDFATKKLVTSMLRRIIPLGVATGAVYTMNGRAIRHITTMRASPEAEEEICHVFSRVAKIMCERAPLLFADFEQVTGGFWVPKYRKV